MTTYPLSEAATIYAIDEEGETTPTVVGKGTLGECASIVEALPKVERLAASIRMDALDLSYNPAEVGELIRYLQEEQPGLSNKDIEDVARKIE